MSQRKFQEQKLKDVIKRMIELSGMQKKYTELEAVQAFRDVVGPIIAKRTPTVFVRQHTLVIKPDSGVLKQELGMRKEFLIEAVNEKLGMQFIEHIEVW
jgi:predicted nucleic acid-binding Zn ribbon protein